MPSPSPRISAPAPTVLTVAARCGVPGENLRSLRNGESPQVSEYLDLLPRKNTVTPDAVGELRDRPLLYFVQRDRLSSDAKQYSHELHTLRRALGSRGERAYLAIVESGVVRVVPVSLDSKKDDWKIYDTNDPQTATLFSRLALGEHDGEGSPSEPDYVFKAMFDLLDKVARKLAEGKSRLDRSDVLSLVGRALFLRFLGDRGIVTAKDVHKIAEKAKCLTDCFSNARNAAETCHWLDVTFNGDFLPLTQKGSRAWFQKAGKHTNGEVFKRLSAILRSEEPDGDDYQPHLWSQFDFAHIPVGLLSQVYEEFCWRWDHDDAEATSVFYTPRGIANYVVEEAFDGMKKAHQARVLDPACGAGVFLVLAFRRLVRARWEKTGHRPKREEIRSILEKQLRGFDISQSALRLAALSLYLTAIELDPKPTPPHKLRFNDLQGRVLFNRRTSSDPPKGAVLGSLDARNLKGNRGKFQLVLCNPPWTSLGEKEKPVAAKFHDIGREVLRERKLTELADTYENPDSVPDLPFIWRAMQWCERGGRLAFVLPARLLFKQGDIGQRAREAIFRAATVTGMLNCSNLSDTKVWPKMQQPFLLFFAQNRPSRPEHEIRFVTPHHDKALNERGEIRIDAKSIELVSQEQTFEEPWLWKALAIGTALDVEVVRKVKACDGRPLEKYWTEDLKLRSSNGYSVKIKGQRDCSFLIGLPNITPSAPFKFVVDGASVPKFLRKTVGRPRTREDYRQPLLLIKEAPGNDRASGRAWLTDEDVAFNQSFHGFSGAGNKDGVSLTSYLHLLIHTDIWMHYALHTSPKLGAERRVIYKEDLEEFLITPWANLTPAQKKAVQQLSNRLLAEDLDVFSDIDAFFAGLYGLSSRDMEVIRDTLSVELPYGAVRKRACLPPREKDKERDNFRKRVETVLRPFFKRLGKEVSVTLDTPASAVATTPYSILTFRVDAELGLESDSKILPEVLAIANQTGASMVYHELPSALAVGVLNQYRYWTPSRARLCAAEILRRHMAPFES